MSEKNEAARDGATLTKNSGRGQIQKGDATLGPLCIDYKEYDKSFSVSRSVWAKLTKDAFFMRKLPALKLILGDKETNDKIRLWVIQDDFFHEMLECWRAEYEEK